jgi:hypothetical protein
VVKERTTSRKSKEEMDKELSEIKIRNGEMDIEDATRIPGTLEV